MSNASSVNPDLVNERKKCTFNVTELTHLLDGGAQKTEERRNRGLRKIFFYLPKRLWPIRLQKNSFWKTPG